MYPLRFQPIFQTYLWGGRRLSSELNKKIGEGPTYAESWEVVDHPDAQSVVVAGELQGRTLHELVCEFPQELLGEKVARQIADANLPAGLQNRFPLLFKFLDANRNLSVQVHPNDRMGAKLDPPDLGKTEAWYVLDAEPGALVYAGLKPGTSESDFRQAVADSKTEEFLYSFEPRSGDCIFIPAGTVHALGKGLLIAEIQQSSNTTFRLYDWGRVDQNGKPRQLHIEQGIGAIDFHGGPVSIQTGSKLDNLRTRLVECDKFTMEKVLISGDTSFHHPDGFTLLVVVKGEVRLVEDPTGKPLTKGETILVPACQESIDLKCQQPSELLFIKI